MASISSERRGFYYGTLMVPEIFFRVTHGTESPSWSLRSRYTFTPALLRNYSRRKVRDADFPGITPQEGHLVLGALVTGLTDYDVECLDGFEGNMYDLTPCEVQVLDPKAINSDGSTNEEMLAAAKEQFEKGKGDIVEAEVYVWCEPIEDLEKEEWSYAEFRKEKMARWVFSGGEEYEEAWEVNRRVNGGEGKVVEEESEGEEVRTKRIVSVIAGIAGEEQQKVEEKGEDIMSAVAAIVDEKQEKQVAEKSKDIVSMIEAIVDEERGKQVGQKDKEILNSAV